MPLPKPHFYRPDIDGIRAIAVLSVIAFHAFPKRLTGGFIGVDIFFVISGFLITQIIINEIDAGKFKIRNFYSRRIRRIIPSLLVVLATTLILGWFLLLPQDYVQLGRVTAGATVFITNFVLWSQVGYFDADAIQKPLLHLWSLSIEEQFYLLWPLILFILFKVRKYAFALTGVMLVASFYTAYHYRYLNPDLAFYSPAPRFWELLVGAALAFAFVYHYKVIEKIHSYRFAVELAAAMSLFAMLVALYFGTEKRSLLTVLIGVLSSAGLILFGTKPNFTSKLVGNPISVWIGLISYPLYLWHWIFLSFGYMYFTGTPPKLARGLSVILSIALSYGCYRLLEVHMRSKAHEFKKIIALLVGLVVIALLGIGIQVSNGVENRVGTSKANMIQLIRAPGSDAGCGELIGNPKHLFHYCRYNNVGGTRTIAITGDSHAQAAWVGLSNYYGKLGINTVLFSNSLCPPFIGVATGMSIPKLNECTESTKQIIDAMTNTKGIDTVIFISRGSYYITAHEEIPIRHVKFMKWPASQQTISSTATKAALFQEALQKTVDLYRAQGKQIYLVSENPELPFDLKNCLDFGVARAKTEAKCEPRNRAHVLDRQSLHRNILQNISGATFIDTLDIFCPDTSCNFLKNGTLLYLDDDHLSRLGSKLQAEVIGKYVK